MHRASDLIGQTLDTYRIVEILGRGGMGIVYRAVDTSLDRTVALKMLHGYLLEDERFLHRFTSEAKALGRLQHPNIVNVYALRQVEPYLFLVMEYVDGGSLQEGVEAHGALTWRMAVPVLRQALQGVAYAHSQHILHRDLKPSNLLVSRYGDVKLADLGLAKIQEETAENAVLTRTGFTGGTLHYMPPEQLEGLRHVDHRSDLYALGMTGFKMVAGRTPFDGVDSDYQIQKAIERHDFQGIDHFVPDLPPGLADIINKATAHDPADRYQSAEEMLAALDAFAARNLPDELPEKALFPFRDDTPVDYFPKVDTEGGFDSPAETPPTAGDAAGADDAPDDDTEVVPTPPAAPVAATPDPTLVERPAAADYERPPKKEPPRDDPPPGGRPGERPGVPLKAAGLPAAGPREAAAADRTRLPDPPVASGRKEVPPRPTPSPRPTSAKPVGRAARPVWVVAVLGIGVVVLVVGLLRLFMGPAEAMLAVRTDPPGARLFLDRALVGTTPVEYPSTEGPHTLRVEMEGYRTLDTSITLDGRGGPLAFTLQRAVAQAVISSDPPGAEVLVDGTSHGATPLRSLTLPTGTYALELRKYGYAPHRAALNIAAGRLTVVDAKLEAAQQLFLSVKSLVEITVNPPADIYIGGFLVAQDTTRYTERLPRGTHVVEVRHARLGTREEQVVIEDTAPRTFTLAFDLEDTPPSQP